MRERPPPSHNSEGSQNEKAILCDIRAWPDGRRVVDSAGDCNAYHQTTLRNPDRRPAGPRRCEVRELARPSRLSLPASRLPPPLRRILVSERCIYSCCANSARAGRRPSCVMVPPTVRHIPFKRQYLRGARQCPRSMQVSLLTRELRQVTTPRGAVTAAHCRPRLWNHLPVAANALS
jgi:hypothetical protein